MVTPKVSIIVPVYNAEKNLRLCVDHILSQKFEDFELLLVNDGSKDSSATICNDYAQNDKRVIVIHKENGGASSARNTGLNAANGEYIAFADADDWMEEEWLSSYIDALEASDLVICGYYRHLNNAVIKKRLEKRTIFKQDYDYNCFNLYKNGQLGYLWSMLFKKSIIWNNELLFDEQMAYQEDLDFILRYLLHTKSFSTSPKLQYHYIYSYNSKYSHSVYGVETIMSSLVKIFSGNNLKYYKKRYGGWLLCSLLNKNNSLTIIEIRQYMTRHGYCLYGITPHVLLLIIFAVPNKWAIKAINIYKKILNK